MSAIGPKFWETCYCSVMEEPESPRYTRPYQPPMSDSIPSKTDQQMVDEAVAMLKTNRYFTVSFTTLSEQTLQAEAQVETVFLETSFVTKDFLDNNAFIERTAVENSHATAHQIYMNSEGLYFNNPRPLSYSVEALQNHYNDPDSRLRIYVIRHVGEHFKPREG
ncbi:MAG TPA: hypothetical protein VLE89_00790 [Chlamydiales bacterium]|nr:hypothetical protein [Chlamydiales bacterium]